MAQTAHTTPFRTSSRQMLLHLPPRRWRRPTFGEFLDQLEHEFGASADLAALMMLGVGRDEKLGPTDIEALCGQIGVPPEDFGIDP